jgi:hypothetical protein
MLLSDISVFQQQDVLSVIMKFCEPWENKDRLSQITLGPLSDKHILCLCRPWQESFFIRSESKSDPRVCIHWQVVTMENSNPADKSGTEICRVSKTIPPLVLFSQPSLLCWADWCDHPRTTVRRFDHLRTLRTTVWHAALVLRHHHTPPSITVNLVVETCFVHKKWNHATNFFGEPSCHYPCPYTSTYRRKGI